MIVKPAIVRTSHQRPVQIVRAFGVDEVNVGAAAHRADGGYALLWPRTHQQRSGTNAEWCGTKAGPKSLDRFYFRHGTDSSFGHHFAWY